MAQNKEQLFQRPLYVFDLPPEILSTITLRNSAEQSHEIAPEPAPSTTGELEEKAGPEDGGSTKATSCTLCGLRFPTVQEQRSHVRSDLHGYNLKQKIRGQKPVGEEEFEALIGGQSSNLSLDDEEDNNDGIKPKDSTLSALLKKQAKISNPEFDDFASKKPKRGAGKPPLFWFTSPTLPENTSLGIYRAIFSDAEQEEESYIVETIRNKQLAPVSPPRVKANSEGVVPVDTSNIGPHYFLCMIGGGHFAAMVVSLAPKMGKKHTGVEERQATVLAHKTFHRYTTRRKQGGAQSSNDSSKGNAHSAGASIRRYNEVALMTEVRDLLKEWKSMIDTAELVFMRATGSANRSTLLGPYEGQVLRNNDPRNRGFPFSTRRATQKELMRAFVELTRVKTSTIDEAALAALNAAPAATLEASKASTKPSKPPKPSKEEEAAILHTTQLTALIRRSKIPAILNYLSSNDLTPAFQFFPANHHTPTPLHFASSLNAGPVVLALLTKAKADPTVMSDDARTPFSLAGDRATRDAFRAARSELGESAWDWNLAGVPAPLSKSEVAERDQRDRVEKTEADKQEAERRKAETERLRKESAQEEANKRDKRLGKGKSLGGQPEKTGAEKREEESRGLTPEARMRIERERRAKAAEDRIRRLQGN
ncbi:uncharacterized protein BDZ99DRAFT_488754 [Mytilinidion resinicola]|uniref:VLRF1 domain-containing protein n=1 Tax=Mytilinidion resinicola TaxID=574789 RepID=A0A6A6YLR9_9PEZI|nr:uncharacterized protein BDZ99DRAFT_488754 [Mytilinidion resinicola]KAF2808925.1 hypothetical protein BDZ99DRAFT_488754 [Mytilinidion resinicola]